MAAMRRYSWHAIAGLLVSAAAAAGFIHLIRDDPATVARAALTVGAVLLLLAVGLLVGGAVLKLRSRRHEMVASYSASVIVKGASFAFLLWFLGHNLAWAATLLLLVSLLLWLLGPQLLVLAVSVGAVAAAAFVLGGLVSPAPVRMLGLCWRIPEPMSGPGLLAYAEAAVAFGPRLQAVARSDVASAAATGGRPMWKRMQDAFDLDRVEHDCPRITLRQPLRRALLHELQVRSRTLGLIALTGFLVALLPLSFGGAVMPGIGGGTPFVSAQEGDSDSERESEEPSEEPADSLTEDYDDAEPDRGRIYDESQVETGDDSGESGGRGSAANTYGETGDDSGLPGDSSGADPYGDTSSGEPGEGGPGGSEGMSGGESGDSVRGDYQQGSQGGPSSDSHPDSEAGTGTGGASAATLKPHQPEDCPDPFRCQKPDCVAARHGEGGGSGGAAQQGGAGGSGSQTGGSGGAGQQGGAGGSGSQQGGSGGAAQQGGAGSSGGQASGSGAAAQQGSGGGSGSGAGAASGGDGGQGGGGSSAAGSAGSAGGGGGSGQSSGSAGNDPFGAAGSGGGAGGSGGDGAGAGQAAGAAAGAGGDAGVGQSGEGGGGEGGGGSGWGSSSTFNQNGAGTGPLTFPAPSEMISIDLPTINGRHVPLIPGVPEERGEQTQSGAGSGSGSLPPPAPGETQEPQTPGQPRQQLPAWIASLLQPSSTGE
jgi:hypothetical protein